MDKNEKYIRDLFKLVGTDSILIIDKQGKLAREYCPLEVIVTVILPDLKIIFQYAILANASSMILAHNHPSGSLKPSEADIAITQKVQEAGKLFDIRLFDHLIISPDGRYYSLADEGCF